MTLQYKMSIIIVIPFTEKYKMKNTKDNVSTYLKKLYASTTWTHKIQEKESDRLRNIDIFLKACSIITLALSASGLFSIIFVANTSLTIATTIISFVSLIVNLITMSCDFKSLSNEHKQSALTFLSLRNKLEATLTDIDYGRFSEEEIIERKDFFEQEYTKCCQSSLSASKTAVKRAKKALYDDKDNTYTTEELNALLPTHLRSTDED